MKVFQQAISMTQQLKEEERAVRLPQYMSRRWKSPSFYVVFMLVLLGCGHSFDLFML